MEYLPIFKCEGCDVEFAVDLSRISRFMGVPVKFIPNKEDSDKPHPREFAIKHIITDMLDGLYEGAALTMRLNKVTAEEIKAMAGDKSKWVDGRQLQHWELDYIDDDGIKEIQIISEEIFFDGTDYTFNLETVMAKQRLSIINGQQ